MRASALFDAFGSGRTLTADASDTFDPVGFGGQHGYYWDYTGLYLLTHRYYDAGAGRFVTRDPIGYKGGINLYGFAGNNPVNNQDPGGTDWSSFWGGVSNGFRRFFLGNGGAKGPRIGQGHGDVGLTDEEMEGLPKLDAHPQQAAAQLTQGEAQVGRTIAEGVASAPVGGEGEAVETATEEIALGLSPYYKTLASKVGAAKYNEWVGRIINQPGSPRFGRLFHQAANRAGRIHFTLDGIGSIERAVQLGKQGFVKGNFTNAELHYIMTNPKIRAKTVFYLGGKVINP